MSWKVEGWKQHLLATAVKQSPSNPLIISPVLPSKNSIRLGFDMLPTINSSSFVAVGCHCAINVLSHRPVRLSCLILWLGFLINPFCKWASEIISSVSAIVVVNKFFPLGEKKALLIDFELLCVANGFRLDRDWSPVNFRISQRFTSQSRPVVANVCPFGWRLMESIYVSAHWLVNTSDSEFRWYFLTLMNWSSCYWGISRTSVFPHGGQCVQCRPLM